MGAARLILPEGNAQRAHWLAAPLTLSRPFSFSLSMDLFSPSSSRSISLTVSPERVLNFFLDKVWERAEEVGGGSERHGGSVSGRLSVAG